MKFINNYYNSIHSKSLKSYATLVDWPSKKRQAKEFKIITSYLKLNKNYSLSDYGCGTGDLIKFLKKKPKIYYGYDINNKFIKICKKRFPGKKYFFYNSSKIRKKTDFIVACGALSVKGKLKENIFSKKLFTILNNIIKCTTISFSANFHWDICPQKKRRDYLFYTNINEIKYFLNSKGIKNYIIKKNKEKFMFYLFASL